MPTYQYVCTACAEPLEAVQSFDDDPLTECPACGGTLRKVFSPVGVVFKGSGFYRTDSRGKPGAERKAASTSAPTAPSADKPAAAKPAGTPAGSSTPSSTATSSSTGGTPPTG